MAAAANDNGTVPLRISNNCGDTIWPGVASQHGTGPGTGGFELPAGSYESFRVSWDWQGRVWGRTNCSFNANGTGPSQLNGVNGNGAACLTGDCFGVVDCEYTVRSAPPLAFSSQVAHGMNEDGRTTGRHSLYSRRVQP